MRFRGVCVAVVLGLAARSTLAQTEPIPPGAIESLFDALLAMLAGLVGGALIGALLFVIGIRLAEKGPALVKRITRRI